MHEGETRNLDGGPPDSERMWAAGPASPRTGGDTLEMVGPYRIIREIGRGGLGHVLLGFREDDQFRKRVAVKLIKKGMDTVEILRRFEQERQVLSALNHPNIARVFEAGQASDGRPYFVMEYIEGQPIDEYCDSEQLPTADRLKVFLKVCSAVQYAHQNLIVHRDIKPTNIVVGTDGEPKLLDFGIAKLLNPDLMRSPVTTQPELRLMTPEYASPEQVQGKPITTASDTYSLGVLLYELLTGQPPYRLGSHLADEVKRVICEVEPERPSTAITKATQVTTREGTAKSLTPEIIARLRDGVPSKLKRRLAGDIDNIVLMAMRKTPRRRYASVEQFSEDIRRHLDGRPVIARKETVGYVLGKFVSRNRGKVAAVSCVMVALAAGLVGTYIQMREAQRQRQIAMEQRTVADESFAFLIRLPAAIGEEAEQQQIKEGATAMRRVAAAAGLQLLRDPDAVLPKDPKYAWYAGELYFQFGSLAGGIGGSGGSDSETAIEMVRRALALWTPLVEADPSDARARASVARAHCAIAKASAADALREYERAIQIAQGGTGPKSYDCQKWLAAALMESGVKLADTDFEAGRSRIERSKAIRAEMRTQRPADRDAERTYSVGLKGWGDFNFRLWRKHREQPESTAYLEAALDACNESLEVRTTIQSGMGRPSRRSRRDVMNAQLQYGYMLHQAGRSPDAVNTLNKALAEARSLRDADAGDERAVTDWAQVSVGLADAKCGVDVAEADRAYRDFLEEATRIEQARGLSPEVLGKQRDAAKQALSQLRQSSPPP